VMPENRRPLLTLIIGVKLTTRGTRGIASFLWLATETCRKNQFQVVHAVDIIEMIAWMIATNQSVEKATPTKTTEHHLHAIFVKHMRAVFEGRHHNLVTDFVLANTDSAAPIYKSSFRFIEFHHKGLRGITRVTSRSCRRR